MFKNEAVILKDTTNEFNKFATKEVVKQFIPFIADVEEYENVLRNSFVSNNEILNSSDGNAERIPEYFKTSKRQYSGYINSSGDTLLELISKMDFIRYSLCDSPAGSTTSADASGIMYPRGTAVDAQYTYNPTNGTTAVDPTTSKNKYNESNHTKSDTGRY